MRKTVAGRSTYYTEKVTDAWGESVRELHGVIRRRPVCVLFLLPPAQHKAMPIRVVGWCRGEPGALHSDGLLVCQDDSVCPMQYSPAFSPEALQVGPYLR